MNPTSGHFLHLDFCNRDVLAAGEVIKQPGEKEIWEIQRCQNICNLGISSSRRCVIGDVRVVVVLLVGPDEGALEYAAAEEGGVLQDGPGIAQGEPTARKKDDVIYE